jgi:flagellum-specific peptidoglycan hydrolase FlgJ
MYKNNKQKFTFYRYDKQTLDFEKVNVNLIGVKIILIGLAISIVTGFAVAPRASIRNLTQEEKIILIREYNGFSKEMLTKKIAELNFRFPHIILAQATLESGHFKSDVFLENNNMFGMKEAFQRTNLAKGTNRGHAYYDSWQEGVYDYALYYATYLYSIKSEEEYYDYLRQNYAGDPTYVQRLKQIINNNNLKSKFK